MSLGINSQEALALAVRIAKATGESLTEAVTIALREPPDELEREVLELGRDCAERLKQSWRSVDHAELLYDERGLPR